MLKKIFKNLWLKAYKLNEENILSLMDKNENAKIIDLGCDNGLWTIKLAQKIKTKHVYGIDIVSERLEEASKIGVKTYNVDLNNELPFEDGFFDVVHANQVIEHISDLDMFVYEINRVLKKGGYAIISTENSSSWCNIFASVLGWQIFSLTNVSRIKTGIGNPLSLHRGSSDFRDLKSWTHKTIFAYRGLIEFFEVHKFKVTKIKGAGYFPLPNIFSFFDKRHSHFITIKAHKK
jgi:ubiquinone/menaquinone biosynthesis C-methylase UbiE